PGFPPVHTANACDLVQLSRHREGGLSHREAAHGRRGLAVRVHAVAVHPHVRDAVRTRQVRHVLLDAVWRVAVVGAGVVDGTHLARDDAAVLHHAVAVLHLAGSPHRRATELLLTRPAPFDRAARLHRGDTRDRLGDDVHLAAKTAPDRAPNQPQPVAGDLEDDGRVVHGEVQGLRIAVDGEAAIRLWLDDTDMRLHRHVLDRGHLVGALDDVVGLFKTAIHITKAKAAVVHPVIHEGVVAPLLDGGRV